MPPEHAAAPPSKVALDKPTFCGTITEARYSARVRRERKPQPWAVRKLMVVFTLGIMGYTAYVYAGRFSVRLMHDGRRPTGIGLLTGWSILYAWMVWAYVKVRASNIHVSRKRMRLRRQNATAALPAWRMARPEPRCRRLGRRRLRARAGRARVAGHRGGAYRRADATFTPAVHVPGTSLPLPGNGHAADDASASMNGNGTANGNATGHPPPPAPRRKSCARPHHLWICFKKSLHWRPRGIARDYFSLTRGLPGFISSSTDTPARSIAERVNDCLHTKYIKLRDYAEHTCIDDTRSLQSPASSCGRTLHCQRQVQDRLRTSPERYLGG
ncbi:hypothetical protein DFH06DRAFT_339310 [Mycena polygramma]|nr:hypothetical protein DFH06DRAFT_339310 [Mycena polygramma]